MNQAMPKDEILLEPTKEADLDLILRMERSPENSSFVRQWTREQHLSAISDENMAHLVVKLPSNNIIGYVILIGITNADQSVEFKRVVIERKGEGFGRAVVRLVKKMFFDEYNVHRLWLEVMVHNERARSLYLSEGFVEEGVHRESLKQGENFISLIVMSLLYSEYYRST